LPVGASEQSLAVRYKLSYEIEVNDEIRAGSGVMQIRVIETTNTRGGGQSIGFDISGEAIPIDLGDGRYLFSLLSGGDGIRIEGWNNAYHSMTHDKFLMVAFSDYAVSAYNILANFRLLKEKMPVVEVPAHILPKLYISSEINEPEAFVYVKPDELDGFGIKIRRVSVAITDEKVTQGRIMRILPWLHEFEGYRPIARYEFIS
jgi:hypothetical protein